MRLAIIQSLLKHLAGDIERDAIFLQRGPHDWCHKVDQPAVALNPCVEAIDVVDPLVTLLTPVHDDVGLGFINHQCHAAHADGRLQAVVLTKDQRANRGKERAGTMGPGVTGRLKDAVDDLIDALIVRQRKKGSFTHGNRLSIAGLPLASQADVVRVLIQHSPAGRRAVKRNATLVFGTRAGFQRRLATLKQEFEHDAVRAADDHPVARPLNWPEDGVQYEDGGRHPKTRV